MIIFRNELKLKFFLNKLIFLNFSRKNYFHKIFRGIPVWNSTILFPKLNIFILYRVHQKKVYKFDALL